MSIMIEVEDVTIIRIKVTAVILRKGHD